MHAAHFQVKWTFKTPCFLYVFTTQERIYEFFVCMCVEAKCMHTHISNNEKEMKCT